MLSKQNLPHVMNGTLWGQEASFHRQIVEGYIGTFHLLGRRKLQDRMVCLPSAWPKLSASQQKRQSADALQVAAIAHCGKRSSCLYLVLIDTICSQYEIKLLLLGEHGCSCHALCCSPFQCTHSHLTASSATGRAFKFHQSGRLLQVQWR